MVVVCYSTQYSSVKYSYSAVFQPISAHQYGSNIRVDVCNCEPFGFKVDHDNHIGGSSTQECNKKVLN